VEQKTKHRPFDMPWHLSLDDREAVCTLVSRQESLWRAQELYLDENAKGFSSFGRHNGRMILYGVMVR
jgi:hypothetical protein